MVDREKLKDIAKDPLELFNYINQHIWKDPNDSEVVSFIQGAREMIEKIGSLPEKYMMVLGYMASMLKKAGIDKNHINIEDIVLRVPEEYKEGFRKLFL